MQSLKSQQFIVFIFRERELIAHWWLVAVREDSQVESLMAGRTLKWALGRDVLLTSCSGAHDAVLQ